MLSIFIDSSFDKFDGRSSTFSGVRTTEEIGAKILLLFWARKNEKAEKKRQNYDMGVEKQPKFFKNSHTYRNCQFDVENEKN